MTSGVEILILLVVILLLFGHRLPSVMRSMGQGITEFKKGLRGDVPSEGTPRLPPDQSQNPR
jgi:sec-independent protein translocase protein TatA